MTGPFSEQQLSLLYDKTSDLVFYMERSGDTYTYRYLNPAARRVFGSAIIGSTISASVPPQVTEELHHHYDKALAADSNCTYRSFNLFTDEKVANETTVTPIKTADGEFILAVTQDISVRKKAEEDYLFFQALIKHSVDPMIIVLRDETIYTMSTSFEQMFGVKKETFIGKSLMTLPGITASDASFIRRTFKKALNGSESASVPIKWQKADDTPANFLVSCSPIHEQAEVVAYFVALTEFTEKFQLKEDLKQTTSILESYKKALNYSALVAISEPAGRLLHVNDNYVSVTGFSAEELIEQNIAETDSEFLPTTEVNRIITSINSGEIWRGQIKQQTKAGEFFWTDATIIPLMDKNGKVQQVLSIRFDITDKKLAEAKLQHMAYTDSLTQLPNRRFLSKTFPALKQKADLAGSWIGVLYIDGDNFKEVNDLFGHETGDEFIYEFGQALKRSVRSNDYVGRIGGDEFLIVLVDVIPEHATDNIKEVSRRIEENLKRGWKIGSQSFSPSASVGAAFYPNDGQTLEQLFHSGDIALLEAKKRGKNQAVLYSELQKVDAMEP